MPRTALSLHVEPFDGPASEWDGFVRHQQGWTSFHLHAWKPLIESVMGHECPYLAARHPSGALLGVLPLVRVRSLLFGHYLVSMPFVNYGGPLGSTEAVEALTRQAIAIAEVGRVKLLEIRNRHQLPIDLPASHRKITVVLDLPDSPEALRKQIGSKLRSQIRRPEKEGVSVRFGADQVLSFFEVFARHMRDLGTPTQPRALFEQIAERFGDDAWFGCAYLGDRPIACGAGFRWGEEFEMTWASALQEFNRFSPNMLLYAAFMDRSIANRVKVFNFGRCSPDSGTHRFKKQWGSRDEQLWWYQHARGKQAVTTPSPDQGAFSWGPRVWRQLPLPLANLVGPLVVRSIP